MLYPKEDRVNNTLMFACRTCQFSEPAASSCVYRNEQSNTVGDTAGITQDVASDPTVGLPGFCSHCGEEILCEPCERESSRNGFEDDDEVGGGRSVQSDSSMAEGGKKTIHNS